MSELNKESVEQAGGDERAAFEAWWQSAEVLKCKRDVAMEAWQARAALAQPSPAPDYFAHADKKLEALLNATALILESPGHDAAHYWAKCLREYDEAHAQVAQARHVPELDPLNLAPHAEAFNEAPAEALKPEQAEAERPEVVARVVHSNPVVLGQCGPLNANDELMTVAQHAASVARWAEMFNRVEQERDAALARIAELETALEPFAAVADAYDDSEDDDHEPYTDMGCDDRLRLTLGQHRAGRIALEGRTPQAQAQHSVPELDQSRSALTEAQMRRIYENSTEAENERLGFAAFARLMRRAEAVHQIAAAPGKEVGHE
ncbi:hypothetical protein QK322_08335 [Pseudomonas aeruginosa]|nr:hypothetical protein [Pseudomonas aeruginosa]